MFCNHQNTLNTGDCNLGPTQTKIGGRSVLGNCQKLEFFFNEYKALQILTGGWCRAGGWSKRDGLGFDPPSELQLERKKTTVIFSLFCAWMERERNEVFEFLSNFLPNLEADRDRTAHLTLEGANPNPINKYNCSFERNKKYNSASKTRGST